MMSLPWHSHEERNFICMKKIVSDIVSDGLRKIFKQEWDSRYQATLGAWNNIAKNGTEMYNMEKGRRRGKENLPKFLNGNINEWDCTVLIDAILYSECIGKDKKVILNPTIATEVDILRQMRNKISHLPKDQLSEHEFENDSEAVRKSFLALGLDTKMIDDIKTRRKLVASFKVLPVHPSHEVIHRTATASAIINDLDNFHKSNNGKLTFFYISGNPGCGKSQLASQIGERLYNERMKKQNELTFVVTLNAETLDTLLESYEDFARHTDILENIITGILDSNQKTDVKIRNLRTKIATRIEIYKNWLVIVDNVEDVKLVSPLLPERRNDKWKRGQVLITTQESRNIPPTNSFTGHIEISSGLDEKESCELLTKLSGNAPDPHDMLKKVAKELDYQALPLAAAAIYLQQVRATEVSPEFSWYDYQQKLSEGKRELTEKILQDTNYQAYSLTMTAAVLLAVKKAAENDVVLRYTFHFLSLASHESLPLEVAVNHVLSVDKNQDKEQVGVTIRKCSLILPDNEVDKVVFVRLHRVVHDAIKVYASKREVEEICNSVEQVATSLYEFIDDSNERPLVPHLKAFHDATTKMFPNRKTWYSENPSSEICEIYSRFGQVLEKYGQFFFAKHFCAASLQICGKDHGSNHVLLAMCYINIGNVHAHLGDLEQAKQYYKRALAIRTEQLGSEHVLVAQCYNNIGNVHFDLGDLEQAKQYYENSLDIRTKQLGSEDVLVAQCYNNIGNVHCRLGDLKEAMQCYDKALRIQTKQLGSGHVLVANCYNNIGNVHLHLLNLKQAKEYYEKALAIQTEQLGYEHVHVAISYNNIGELHFRLCDLEQAKRYYDMALAIWTEQLGFKHVDVATCCSNIGNVHFCLRDLKQAKQSYEKALAIYTEQLGSDHIEAVNCRLMLETLHILSSGVVTAIFWL